MTSAINLTANGVKAFSNIPGPKSLPVIGNLWRYLPLIGHYDVEKLHESGHYNLKKYGPIVREHVYGNFNIVHLFDAKHIEKVFRTEGRHPERRSHRAVGKYRTEHQEKFNSGGIFCENGKEWYRLRKISQSTLLNPAIVNSYITECENITDELIDLVKENRDGNLEMTDFEDDLYKWSLENICVVTLDTRLGCLNPNLAPDSDGVQFIKASHDTIEGVMHTETGQADLWKYYPTKSYRQVCRGQGKMAEIAMKYLKLKQESMDKQPDDRSVLANFFRVPEATEKDVLGAVLDLLMAGIDTTAFSSGFVLYYLARNPKAQEKMRDEINKFIPEKQSKITPEIISKLTFLKACVKETMRLCPLAIGVGRLTTQEISIDGYPIPVGTMIITQNQVACRQEENFRNANSFVPERWLEDRSKRPSSFLSLPFGFGPRSCLGRRFSDMNSYVLLAKLIQNFKIEYHYEDIGIKTRLINIPDRPMRFRFIDLP
ncbi:Mitochondrial cytochrome P450 -like protein [Halotydeus destructor]|nr:Mitochondrial cytochrome P450 -like protein [Halotydeus destructor]